MRKEQYMTIYTKTGKKGNGITFGSKYLELTGVINKTFTNILK